MSSSPVRALLCCGVTVAACCACSGSNVQSGSGGSTFGGNASSLGGSSAGGNRATGGVSPNGGATVLASGGTSAAGGAVSTGGITSSSNGGNTTGGTQTSSGGVATGGTATGGEATTGGFPSSAGAATGGKATGGAETGGAATGGKATGGSATGGKATGGSATGGSATGGSATGGRATGGAATGGAATGGTSAGAQCSTGSSGFTLSWQDDFNTLNTSTWQLQSFTYAGNLAMFTPNNASVANGIFTMSLTANSSSTTSPYYGVEMRSAQTLTYGKVSSRMRFATGSGVVSGLVLFYTPYPNCNWNEIDIEHLGNSSNTSQLNAQVFTGTPVSGCTTSVTPTQDPLVVNLGFNAETAFHQYDIEWTPTSVKFYGDCVLLRTWTANIARMTLPQTILYTIWASSSAAWAGAVNSSSAPTSADVDWIKVYNYTG